MNCLGQDTALKVPPLSNKVGTHINVSLAPVEA